MKTIIKVIISFGVFWHLACEDVIEVDVPEEEPRLIVNALIRIDTSTTVFYPRVTVGLTSSFFGTIPVTGLEDITITNLDADNTGGENSIILVETGENTGVYEREANTDLFTFGEIILQLTHNGRSYLARTRYVPTVPITSLEQGTETLFNDDDTEIQISVQDIEGQDDFYVLGFGEGEFLVLEDQFFDGQEFGFSYFLERNVELGEELTVSILGADQDLYNYMNLLIEQTEDNLGVFETPVATVRGNIFDVTDFDNVEVLDNVGQPNVFPLGYFAIVQEFTETLVIE